MIKRRNKIIIFTALIVILISSLLYSLAYRYLIERDEKAVTNSISSSSTAKNDVTYDDWNYSCNNFSINIEKKETGDGDNKITLTLT